jgi:hypothetical protein
VKQDESSPGQLEEKHSIPYSKIAKAKRLGSLAQVVECLLSMHRTPHSNASANHIIKFFAADKWERHGTSKKYVFRSLLQGLLKKINLTVNRVIISFTLLYLDIK